MKDTIDNLLDRVLDGMGWGYEYLMSDYATSKQAEERYEKEGKAEIAKAKSEIKQALLEDMLGLIHMIEEIEWVKRDELLSHENIVNANKLRQEITNYINGDSDE